MGKELGVAAELQLEITKYNKEYSAQKLVDETCD